MSFRYLSAALLLLSLAWRPAQALTPPEAIDRYLNGWADRENGREAKALSIHIDASLPSLKKRASMSGLKLISRTGRVLYRNLGFTGDNIVVTEVIARFLANDKDRGKRNTEMGLTRQNYVIAYSGPADYHGRRAYVFRVKPKRKQHGLFKGELWLADDNGTPLRLWGEFVKSPSIFVRRFLFVEDYSTSDCCGQPVRLLLTVQTRIAGEADLIMWMHPLDANDAAAIVSTDAGGDEGASSGSHNANQ